MLDRKTTAGGLRLAMSALLLLAPLLVIAGSAAALTDPTVTELFTADVGLWGEDLIEFTVINPSDSSVAEIVGFAVETDYPSDLDVPPGWVGRGLWASRWTQPMGTNLMSWSNFFGGISYPFGNSYASGYFLSFAPDNVTLPTILLDANIPTFSFLNAAAAISPGETVTGFNAWVGGPMSDYVLAHVGDANASFSAPSGFSTFMGETVVIPEPSTALLLGFGLLGALATVRRFTRR